MSSNLLIFCASLCQNCLHIFTETQFHTPGGQLDIMNTALLKQNFVGIVNVLHVSGIILNVIKFLSLLFFQEQLLNSLYTYWQFC